VRRETFAMRLRRLRQARGWTQTRLAHASGLDPSTISILERGRRAQRSSNSPRLTTLLSLAEAFGAESLALWDGVWFS
jgi:transcriptional regulator with XRE-family HTH domain